MRSALAILLLGLSAAPATGQLAGNFSAPASRASLPAPVRDAVAPYDARCLAAGGMPGNAPDLIRIADVTRDIIPDYIVDLTAYACDGKADFIDRRAGDRVIVFAGNLRLKFPPQTGATELEMARRRALADWVPGPSDAVTRFFVANVYATRVSTAEGGLARLFVSDSAECGKPGAANILLARWEWCRREFGNLFYPLGWGLKPAPPPSTPGYDAFKAGHFADAARLWAAAVDQGDAESMLALGNLYAEGKKDVAQDRPRAFALYRRAAEAVPWQTVPPLKSPTEMAEEGISRNEIIQRQDQANAINSITARAMFQVALAYEGGIGVARNQVEAANWFRRWAGATEDETIRGQRLQTLAERNIRF